MPSKLYELESLTELPESPHMARSDAPTKASKKHRSLWRAAKGIMLRFNDPSDTRATLWVSAGILILEAVMCPLIITKVPCARSVALYCNV